MATHYFLTEQVYQICTSFHRFLQQNNVFFKIFCLKLILKQHKTEECVTRIGDMSPHSQPERGGPPLRDRPAGFGAAEMEQKTIPRGVAALGGLATLRRPCASTVALGKVDCKFFDHFTKIYELTDTTMT